MNTLIEELRTARSRRRLDLSRYTSDASFSPLRPHLALPVVRKDNYERFLLLALVSLPLSLGLLASRSQGSDDHSDSDCNSDVFASIIRSVHTSTWILRKLSSIIEEGSRVQLFIRSCLVIVRIYRAILDGLAVLMENAVALKPALFPKPETGCANRAGDRRSGLCTAFDSGPRVNLSHEYSPLTPLEDLLTSICICACEVKRSATLLRSVLCGDTCPFELPKTLPKLIRIVLSSSYPHLMAYLGKVATAQHLSMPGISLDSSALESEVDSAAAQSMLYHVYASTTLARAPIHDIHNHMDQGDGDCSVADVENKEGNHGDLVDEQQLRVGRLNPDSSVSSDFREILYDSDSDSIPLSPTYS